MAGSFKHALQNLLRLHGLEQRYHQHLLMMHWSQWVGELIAQRTTDLFVKEHTLYIRLSSASLKHELHAKAAQLLKTIQEACPKAHIRRLRLV